MMFLLCFFIIFLSIQSKCELPKIDVHRIPKPIQEFMIREKPIIPNRLLQPFLNESIAHILMNPLDDVINDSKEESIPKVFEEDDDKKMHELLGLTELIKFCALPKQFSELPFLFPRFLCGLSAVYREYNRTRLPYTKSIFPRVTDAVKFLNDPVNYPCHSMNMTDVVALVPGRIYSGCVRDTNPRNFSQFDSAFVMTHPFPDAKKCTTEEIPQKPKCELRSILIQHKILYQEKECCCDGDMCASLIFTQTTSLTPLVMKTIDLSKEALIPFPMKSTTLKTTTKRRRFGNSKKPITVDFNPLFGS